MFEAERIVSAVPGPRSLALAQRLQAAECRGITYLSEDFPVFWETARGATITDVDGNRYLDLTSAFGVAAIGHTNPAVVQAITAQAQRLIHGMGDVHPSAVRTQLIERLIGLAPIENARAYLCSTGAEAVEFALKTALLATSKPDILAFEGAYHGLSYGTLEIAGNPTFRQPWRRQLRDTTSFVAFPDQARPAALEIALACVEQELCKRPSIGAVVCEPIQGRAGVIIPPAGFLRGLHALCRAHGALLILDEIYTGLGRTGHMFAAQYESVQPDLLCIGKALGGGFPISATLGCAKVMDAWKPSQGEALHTSTYLGNPLGCAAALATLDEIDRLEIPTAAMRIGQIIAANMHRLRTLPSIRDVRGRGGLWGLEMSDGAIARNIVVRALARGLIVLQAGMRGEVIQLAPPLVIEPDQLEHALDLLISTITAEAHS